jgi:hypothetical protein
MIQLVFDGKTFLKNQNFLTHGLLFLNKLRKQGVKNDCTLI